MTTYVAKPSTIQRNWTLIDAANKTIGRLATEIARRLRGKHKPIFTPHIDTGDYIVVVNAAKLSISGRKAENKIYYRHTGYNGGLKKQTFNELQQKRPGRALELAVRGMLPKGPLGRQIFRKLKIYSGSEHKHHAQNPQPLDY